MWRFDGWNVKSNSFTPYFLINLSLRFFNSHRSGSPLAPPPHIGIGSSSPSLNALAQASGQLSSSDWKSPRLTAISNESPFNSGNGQSLSSSSHKSPCLTAISSESSFSSGNGHHSWSEVLVAECWKNAKATGFNLRYLTSQTKQTRVHKGTIVRVSKA